MGSLNYCGRSFPSPFPARQHLAMLVTGWACAQKSVRGSERTCSGACQPLGARAPEFFRPQRSEVTEPRRSSFASRLPSPGQMAPAQRCPLCRQTFFCGRGHVYSRKHQRQLKVALERLLPQVRTGGWRGPWTAWAGAAGGL